MELGRVFGDRLWRSALIAAALALFFAEVHAAERSRGVGVRPNSAAETPADSGEGSSGGLDIAPLGGKSAPTEASQSAAPAPIKSQAPVRLALRGASADSALGAGATAPFEIVALTANPDVIWDAMTRDASAGGAMLAQNIGRSDLPALIDRAAAVRWLIARAARGPQPLRITPAGRTAKKGERVDIAVAGVQGRSLVLFCLAGDGTVQLLYPLGSDPPFVRQTEYRLSLIAREPFGADELISIAAAQPLDRLEQALRRLDKRKGAEQIVELISNFAGADAIVGAAAILTTP